MPDITSFTLDDLDRVKVYDTVTTPGQSAAKLTYQYDAFGNRTQMVQQTGSGASLITVTTNYTEYDYLNWLTKPNQSATNFPSWQNKSVKLDYRADSSIQTITRYSDLTQTTVVVKSDYVQYSWDQRNQLTKVEFYNAPVNGTATLAKTLAYTYDDSSNRINKTLTVPGQAVVAENYVYDGDQLVAVMNATGAIQHEYFDGSSLDQVFADQTLLSGVLWPLEDCTGAAWDVISTAGVVLDHRKIDSFGKITSQTGPTVDYDQFFSGLSYCHTAARSDLDHKPQQPGRFRKTE